MWKYLLISLTDAEERRNKRQINDYFDCCPVDKRAQKCAVIENSCYHVMNCDTITDAQGRDSVVCTKEKHIYGDVRCCIPCCLGDVPEWNPSPLCSANLSREQLCPDYDFA